MDRVLVSFVSGLTIGFFATYLICGIAIRFGYEYIDSAAFKTSSPEEYERRVEQLTMPRVVFISIAGGLGCAAACAMAVSGLPQPASARAPARRPVRKTAGTREKPLSASEFERVLQCCLFVDLRERSPEFLQGLIVGRLAESAPELAARIDGFSEEHMTALLQDIRVQAATW